VVAGLKAAMSQRQQRRDSEVWSKDPSDTSTINAGVHGVGAGDLLDAGRCWRRRSLFSSERLDLILSNLRRNLGRTSHCKPVSQQLTCAGDVQQRRHHHQHQQQQQQQQRAAGKHRRVTDINKQTTLDRD